MTDSNSTSDPERQRLAAAIGQLPDAEKLVATLVWFEGLTLDEAADVLGVSIEEAGDLHARAIERVSESAGRESAKPLSTSEASRLESWSRLAVDRLCAVDWRRYDAGLADRYARYFDAHPELRGEQRYSARHLRAALPPGWAELADEVPGASWHRHHLSGKSSQTLAVGLLGVAARLDPSLAWLWEALAPLPDPAEPAPRMVFEYELDASVLDEHPRQTSIDVLIDDPSVLICIESKRREDGIGTCSCGKDGGAPLKGACAERVLERSAYWDAARDVFGLPPREPSRPCPISLSYQAVRNAAAARALAGPERLAVFALLYDRENPYFRATAEWPGWPDLLGSAVSAYSDSDEFRFVAASWQEILTLLPLDDETRRWATEKHGL